MRITAVSVSEVPILQVLFVFHHLPLVAHPFFILKMIPPRNILCIANVPTTKYLLRNLNGMIRRLLTDAYCLSQFKTYQIPLS